MTTPILLAPLLRAAGRRIGTVDARLLLAHVLGRPPAQLVVLDRMRADEAARFDELVTRRAAGEPVQHLTGRAWFRHVEVAVGPGVFVPRPETEVMVGWALDRLAGLGDTPVVVELATGSGVIAKALADEAPAARVHAVELAPEAYAYAERNLAGTEVDLRLGDLAEAFTELDGTVDLVIANPPYIPLEAWESVPAEVRDFDPHLALFSGLDGLDALRGVARTAARLLRTGGWLCAEHAEVQHDSVQQLVLDTGAYTEVRDHRDLTDRWRFVTARRTGNAG